MSICDTMGPAPRDNSGQRTQKRDLPHEGRRSRGGGGGAWDEAKMSGDCLGGAGSQALVTLSKVQGVWALRGSEPGPLVTPT